MKRISLSILIGLVATTIVFGITNLAFNISLPEEKYTNLLSVVEKSGFLTVDDYLNAKVNSVINDERIGKLLTLWNSATLIQQENAFRILSGSTNFVFVP